VISSLVKEVMQACNLQQKGLAEVLGVSIDRVKSLTSGKVKDFTREEREALVNNLGIHPTWLITQQGPMFSHEEEDETDDEFADRIQAETRMRRLVEALPLDEFARMRLAALMRGDPAQDAPRIAEAIREAALDKGEQLLIDNYRRSSDEGRAYLVQESALVAAGLRAPPQRAAAGAPPTRIEKQVNVTASAQGSQAAGRKIVNRGEKT